MSATAPDTAAPRDSAEPAARKALQAARRAFESGRTRSAEWRLEQLQALKRMLVECEQEFLDALAEDLGKPPMEAWGTELNYVAGEVDYFSRRLRRWMRPRSVPTPLSSLPGRSWIQPEPLGVVLVMGAWNYPLQLTLAPLVPVLAAGNCAVLKPSELAPATSAAIAKRLPEYLDREAMHVVEGGVPVATALLGERWDHILYTGGAEVGRIVMRAAAEYLTPVTLELGGKSPCVVLPDAPIEVTARRIAWGRFTNAGQTCIAPDYVLTDADTEARLAPAIAREVEAMYGNEPADSDSYGRIVNERHFDRLVRLLDSGSVVTGGQHDRARRYIAPTVLGGVSPDAPAMQEEIFGPILSIVRADSLDDAIRFVRAGEKPLAAYLFTRDRAAQQRFAAEVSSGNLCLNDTMMFMAVPGLTFGGVGESGMGQYKGEQGFLRFSHGKAVMRRGLWPDIRLRYAPYTEKAFRLLRRFM
ncbi:MAG: aldehyde dehydrogenase family protein [Xanthomonadales bacterium]|nr:aldehyde dehydrogenase family protein [Xanthomonadales bacterium]